jgi:O-antigen/teichoic acid export membrane protein
MSSVRRVTKNAVALSTTSVGRVALGLILQLYVARQLGAGGLGKYAVVLAFVTVFQVVADLGMPRLVTRELARDHRPNRYFYAAIWVQLVGAIVAYGGLILAIQLFGYKQDTSRALYIAGLSLFPYAVTSACEACFQGMERMELVAGIETASYVMQLLLAVVLLASGHGIVALGGVIVVGEGMAALLCLYTALRMGFLLPVRLDAAFSWQSARAAPPFFLLAVSVVVFSRLDVIMVSKIMGERAAGIYSAAYLIVRAINLVVTGYSDALYPAFSRLHKSGSGRDRMAMMARKALQYGLIFVLPIAVGTTILAPDIIGLLYGNHQYVEAAIVLRLVIWETVPFLVNAILSRLLIASDLQRLSVQVAVVKLGAASVYYVSLISLFRLPGAAVATVLSTTTGTILNWHFVKKHLVSLNPLRLAMKPAMAAGLMAVMLVILSAWGPWALIPLGALVYAGLLFGLRAFASEDWLILRQLLRPGGVG